MGTKETCYLCVYACVTQQTHTHTHTPTQNKHMHIHTHTHTQNKHTHKTNTHRCAHTHACLPILSVWNRYKTYSA
jgi:hypothetical protein